MKDVLQDMAVAYFPDNAVMRSKWLAAVEYLRTKSTAGWALDRPVSKTPESSVLRAWVAPEIKVAVTLPDEQIVPPDNVTRIPKKARR